MFQKPPLTFNSGGFPQKKMPKKSISGLKIFLGTSFFSSWLTIIMPQLQVGEDCEQEKEVHRPYRYKRADPAKVNRLEAFQKHDNIRLNKNEEKSPNTSD
jgi:hypothetical protein